jgi:hypothetical protein
MATQFDRRTKQPRGMDLRALIANTQTATRPTHHDGLKRKKKRKNDKQARAVGHTSLTVAVADVGDEED